jgi:hypothetical protein
MVNRDCRGKRDLPSFGELGATEGDSKLCKQAYWKSIDSLTGKLRCTEPTYPAYTNTSNSELDVLGRSGQSPCVEIPHDDHVT